MLIFPADWQATHSSDYWELNGRQRRLEAVVGMIAAIDKRDTVIHAVKTSRSRDRTARLLAAFLDIQIGDVDDAIRAAYSAREEALYGRLQDERLQLQIEIESYIGRIKDHYLQEIWRPQDVDDESNPPRPGEMTRLSTTQDILTTRTREGLLLELLDAGEELIGQVEVKFADNLPDEAPNTPVAERLYWTDRQFCSTTGSNLLPDGPILAPVAAIELAELRCQIEAEFSPVFASPGEHGRWATSLLPITELDGNGLAIDTLVDEAPVWRFDKSEVLRLEWPKIDDMLTAINRAIRHGDTVLGLTFNRKERKWDSRESD